MEIDKNLVKNIFIYLAKFGGMIKTLTKYIVKMVEYIYKSLLDLTILLTKISIVIYINSSSICILPISSRKKIVHQKKLHR